MIRTEDEFRQTQEVLSKLQLSLDKQRAQNGESKPGEMGYLIEQGLVEQIEELKFQVDAFKALESGTSVPLRSLADIGIILAAARVVKKLTQAELAKMLHMRQQQIQRYEAEDYRGIAIERMARVVDALGIAFHRL